MLAHSLASKYDRTLVLSGLACAVLICCLYLANGAGLHAPDGSQISRTSWTPTYFALVFLMWATMMVVMMVPSATPMILLFARASRTARLNGRPFVSTVYFGSGYVLAWTVFSVAATCLQWLLNGLSLLTPQMASASSTLGAILLIAAGAYQFTPLKDACLRHCRAPLRFLSQRWRTGARGAIAMGVEHGSYCLGCCWLLMGLLFYGGVMSLWWIVGLSVYVLIEKLAPGGPLIGRCSGLALIVAGGYLLIASDNIIEL